MLTPEKSPKKLVHRLLSTNEVEEGLQEHNLSWKLEGDFISQTFVFKTFREAVAFFNQVCQIADEKNHHPDILISYVKVHITLKTKDVNGLTDKDLELAHLIEIEAKTFF